MEDETNNELLINTESEQPTNQQTQQPTPEQNQEATETPKQEEQKMSEVDLSKLSDEDRYREILKGYSDEEIEKEIDECRNIIRKCDERLSPTGSFLDAFKLIVTRKLPPDIPNWREREINSEKWPAKKRLDLLEKEQERRRCQK